jgi:NMD protein affecting ribosome stability and mRNA decay
MCPNCGTEYACGCAGCVKNARFGDKTPWIHEVEDNILLVSCPNCGLTKTEDEWMDLDYARFRQQQEEQEIIDYYASQR